MCNHGNAITRMFSCYTKKLNKYFLSWWQFFVVILKVYNFLEKKKSQFKASIGNELEKAKKRP